MKLYRSRTDSRLFGLCGGIAQSAGLDPTWVRLGFVIGGFVTGGTLFILYFIACMVVPKEPAVTTAGLYETYPYQSSYASASNHTANEVDAMMKDLEQKALVREIQALRSKLSQYEKQAEGA